jgi:hypothetical protein
MVDEVIGGLPIPPDIAAALDEHFANGALPLRNVFNVRPTGDELLCRVEYCRTEERRDGRWVQVQQSK